MNYYYFSVYGTGFKLMKFDGHKGCEEIKYPHISCEVYDILVSDTNLFIRYLKCDFRLI